MSTVFADTSYYIALLHAEDEFHEAALAFTDRFDGEVVTTAWVVTELANALARAANRRSFLALHADLVEDDRVHIVAPTRELFDHGLALYEQRSDKDWSLTDCISFVVMERMALKEALTADRHFQQAGFTTLLS